MVGFGKSVMTVNKVCLICIRDSCRGAAVELVEPQHVGVARGILHNCVFMSWSYGLG